MTKTEFIQILSNGIAPLTILERQEILSDYEEHFRQGLENGQNEAEICASLGDPYSIARDYLDESTQRQFEEQFYGVKTTPVQEEVKSRNIVAKIALAAALIFVNLIFVLPIVLGIFGTLIGFTVAGFGIAVAGIIIIFSVIYGWIYIVAGIACICLGILLCIGFGLLIGLFCKLIATYVKWNAHVVSGRS